MLKIKLIIKYKNNNYCPPYFGWCIFKRDSGGEWDYNECNECETETTG